MMKWEVQEMNLKDFATTKADKKKGITKMPRKESAVNYLVNDLARTLP
jgi:hypothetical protein